MVTVPDPTPEERARMGRWMGKMAIFWIVLSAAYAAPGVWSFVDHRAHGFGLYWQFGFAGANGVVAVLYAFRARKLRKVEDLQ
jgi:hypothetical protein